MSAIQIACVVVARLEERFGSPLRSICAMPLKAPQTRTSQKVQMVLEADLWRLSTSSLRQIMKRILGSNFRTANLPAKGSNIGGRTHPGR